MKTKIASLALPKGFGISPVLFHLGPISDTLLSSHYFYRIIDIADLGIEMIPVSAKQDGR
jgi:hypothetical protein